MHLLIDMGNTRLKWALLDQNTLTNSTAIANQDLSLAYLRQQWHALPAPEAMLIACVSQPALLQKVITAATELWPGLTVIKATAQADAYGLQNAYIQPEKLGVDRWLAMLAVRHYYPGAACIADCGTAITIDVLDQHGKHQGGMISPGLRLMKQALALGTEALDFYDSPAVTGLAAHTEAAIISGTLTAATGLITLVLGQQANLPLIMTGGDAPVIAQHLSVHAIIDPDLVLRGLAVLALKQ